MDAKEWLEKPENQTKLEILFWDLETFDVFQKDIECLIEQYSNYKNQELQAKILNFRKTLSENITINGSESDILGQHDKYLLNIYDVYFEIVKLTKDKIGNND